MNVVYLMSWCMFQVCSQEVQWTPHSRFWYHYYESGSSNLSFTHLDLEIILLPSALARGSESRIYSHKVCMYVRTYVVGHAQECHAECCYIPLVWAICVSHSLTHSDMLDSDGWVDDSVLWRWRWRSGTMAWRCHCGLDTTKTKQLLLGLQT